MLELGHDGGLFGRFHTPVDQADTQLTQGAAQLLEGGFGGLAGQLFGLLDQRTHPIRLAAFGAGGADPLDHFEAAAVGDQYSIDGCTPGRQLVEDRGVEIGVGTHRQGPRDRRCGHDQLMRAELAAHAFLA
ncbi:hypothetical protein D3C80_1083910 [compost metagenome]